MNCLCIYGIGHYNKTKPNQFSLNLGADTTHVLYCNYFLINFKSGYDLVIYKKGLLKISFLIRFNRTFIKLKRIIQKLHRADIRPEVRLINLLADCKLLFSKCLFEISGYNG